MKHVYAIKRIKMGHNVKYFTFESYISYQKMTPSIISTIKEAERGDTCIVLSTSHYFKIHKEMKVSFHLKTFLWSFSCSLVCSIIL